MKGFYLHYCPYESILRRGSDEITSEGGVRPSIFWCNEGSMFLREFRFWTGCVGRCVITLVLTYDVRKRSRSIGRTAFIPPFSFALALDNGFKRVQTGRFRKKLSFGARNIVNGPMHTLTSKCVSHVHIAGKSKRMLSIICGGNCAAVGQRLDNFVPSVTQEIRGLRCRGRS